MRAAGTNAAGTNAPPSRGTKAYNQGRRRVRRDGEHAGVCSGDVVV